MAQMVRKQIYLARRQEQLLKRLARTQGISEAEVIRQALDDRVARGNARQAASDPAAWAEIVKFITARRTAKPAAHQPRDWKREDLYEERLSRYDRHSG